MLIGMQFPMALCWKPLQSLSTGIPVHPPLPYIFFNLRKILELST